MRLNYSKIFLLGFGFFGVSVIWSVYNAFVPVFLSQRFGLNVRWIGFFMTLDNIAALLIQPPVGAWSDRLRTPIGRRMPFILVGAPIGALAFGFIPLVHFLPLFVACTSTLLISMAFWRTPVVALMPDITPSRFRSQANGVINFMGGIGSIIAFLGGSKLYDMNPAFPFWLGSVLVILASLLVLLFIREPKDFPPGEKVPSMVDGIKEVIGDANKSALRILLAIFCWFVGYNAVEAFFNLYAIYHLDIGESNGARLLGDLALLFVLFALPAGYVGAKLGRRRTILIGISVMAVVLLAIFLLPVDSLLQPLFNLPVLGIVPVVGAPAVLPIIGLLMMFAGVAWACININSLPMVVDMTEDARLGTYTGLYYLFSTLAAIAGPNVNGWVISLAGNNYNAVMVSASVFFVLALVMMWGVTRGEMQDSPTSSGI